MANENNIPTPKQALTENLTLVIRELWNEASARFATKQEAGADFASVSECQAAMNELT